MDVSAHPTSCTRVPDCCWHLANREQRRIVPTAHIASRYACTNCSTAPDVFGHIYCTVGHAESAGCAPRQRRLITSTFCATGAQRQMPFTYTVDLSSIWRPATPWRRSLHQTSLQQSQHVCFTTHALTKALARISVRWRISSSIPEPWRDSRAASRI